MREASGRRRARPREPARPRIQPAASSGVSLKASIAMRMACRYSSMSRTRRTSMPGARGEDLRARRRAMAVAVASKGGRVAGSKPRSRRRPRRAPRGEHDGPTCQTLRAKPASRTMRRTSAIVSVEVGGGRADAGRHATACSPARRASVKRDRCVGATPRDAVEVVVGLLGELSERRGGDGDGGVTPA